MLYFKINENLKKTAILCNYELLPNRVGGMDYFFWQFDKKCKQNNIQIDWFFPNESSSGNYNELNIIDTNYQNVEAFFVKYCESNTQNYDFIFTHFVELCIPIFKKIKAFSKAKIIAVDHNPRPINGHSFKKKLEKKVKGFLYSKYIDSFIAVSEYSKKALKKDFGSLINNKIEIIFNGLDVIKYIQKTNFELQHKLIVACHLRKEKGIQDLIQAVYLSNKEKNIEFVIDIYGTGNYENELKQMIKDFSLTNFFNFKGSVSNLNEIYYKYDYLIHPSHGETFCYTVVESLLSNLPVITTNIHGNVLELVKENSNGFLFDATNIEQLKEILLNISNNKICIQDFSSNNQLVKNLSLENMVEKYFNLIV